MTSSNGSVYAPAVVPGEVHTALLNAGVIPEPYFQFNELALKWVALDNWTFSRKFSAPATAPNASTFLQFDGLDTIASVRVNGELVGTSVNSFARWEVDLPAGLLKDGVDTNTISVAFTCAQCAGQDAAAKYPVPLREFRANRCV